jgi:hypothetical protein
MLVARTGWIHIPQQVRWQQRVKHTLSQSHLLRHATSQSNHLS